jgi:acetylornithine deacetylase/succinyl-diaminopimelate desuccinylase-like protein
MKKSVVTALLFSLFLSVIAAQSPDIQKIRLYRQQQENSWLNQFLSFLSIPNIANVLPDRQLNAERIMELMKQRSIEHVQLLYPLSKDAPPAVYGDVMEPGAKKTIFFYAHYDGQPVDSTKWAKGLHPFKPVIINGPLREQNEFVSLAKQAGQPVKINPEWRIVARGASDDKAGVMAILLAYEAVKACGLVPAYNIKFFFEGEEEAGSAHLDEILQQHASVLQSDLWIICDGPVHQSGKKLVSFGVRGDAGMEITVYGSKRPLHSGHYGNWAPNPALMLSRLLASMKDEDGKVLVKGFYDHVKPLTTAERQALSEVPSIDAKMKDELGFIQTETKNQSLVQSIMLPALNINGMQSAGTGKLASNVIPATAIATLDLRLVPGTDYRQQQQLVEAHIRSQGFYITQQEPTDDERIKYPKIAKVILSKGYNAQRTPIDMPIAQQVMAAVRSTTTDQVVLMPSMGGSLPLFLFEQYLSAKTITVPIANHDNNQHAENENIRLQNFWNGIETMAALMLMK